MPTFSIPRTKVTKRLPRTPKNECFEITGYFNCVLTKKLGLDILFQIERILLNLVEIVKMRQFCQRALKVACDFEAFGSNQSLNKNLSIRSLKFVVRATVTPSILLVEHSKCLIWTMERYTRQHEHLQCSGGNCNSPNIMLCSC